MRLWLWISKGVALGKEEFGYRKKKNGLQLRIAAEDNKQINYCLPFLK